MRIESIIEISHFDANSTEVAPAGSRNQPKKLNHRMKALRMILFLLGLVGLFAGTPLVLFLLVMSGFAEPDGRLWIRIYSVAIPLFSIAFLVAGIVMKPQSNQK
jgi:O-antigen/teichoic acid export membrane protein